MVPSPDRTTIQVWITLHAKTNFPDDVTMLHGYVDWQRLYDYLLTNSLGARESQSRTKDLSFAIPQTRFLSPQDKVMTIDGLVLPTKLGVLQWKRQALTNSFVPLNPLVFEMNGNPLPPFVPFVIQWWMSPIPQVFRSIQASSNGAHFTASEHIITTPRISVLREYTIHEEYTWIPIPADEGTLDLHSRNSLSPRSSRATKADLPRTRIVGPCSLSLPSSTAISIQTCHIPPPSPTPQLSIQKYSVTNSPIPKGEAVRMTITVENSGNADAIAVYAKFYVSSDKYDDFMNVTSDQQGHYLGHIIAGRSRTFTVFLGPTINEAKHALNKGQFYITRAEVWASNADLVALENKEYFYVDHLNTDGNHNILAVLYYDQAFLDRYADNVGTDAAVMIKDSLTKPIYYDPDPSNPPTGKWITFTSLFSTVITPLLVKTWNPTSSEPFSLLNEVKNTAGTDLSLSTGAWEVLPNKSKGTSPKNHGYDLLIGVTGKISSTSTVGATDNLGNAIVTMGGWLFMNLFPLSLSYDEQLLLFLHELHHTYGAWHLVSAGYVMSSSRGPKYYTSTVSVTSSSASRYDGV